MDENITAMKFTSQTGNVVMGSKDNQSTSGSDNQLQGVIFNMPANTVFQLPKPGRFIGEGVDEKAVDTLDRRELSQEEENKFYKKVFKTSLI